VFLTKAVGFFHFNTGTRIAVSIRRGVRLVRISVPLGGGVGGSNPAPAPISNTLKAAGDRGFRHSETAKNGKLGEIGRGPWFPARSEATAAKGGGSV